MVFGLQDVWKTALHIHNRGNESDDSMFDLDCPIKRKQRSINEPATRPQENLHTFSDSPIEERARLPVTAKASLLVTDNGICHIAGAGSAISQCISDAENDKPVASVPARDADADNSDSSDSEDDMACAAPNTKDTGASEPNPDNANQARKSTKHRGTSDLSVGFQIRHEW